MAAFAVVLTAACGTSSRAAQGRPPTTATVIAPAARPAASHVLRVAPHAGRSIALAPEPGVSKVELRRADRLIEATIADLSRLRTPAQAYAAGYRSIGDTATVDEHYVNWSYVDDGHILDPLRPESVVYERRDGVQTAVAAMYSLPFGSTFADVPDVGGALTQWHVHADLCLTNDVRHRVLSGFTTVAGSCPPGTSKASNTPMLHVWVVSEPCGPFASIEGVGAGRVPAGQTRNCDTRNASVP